MLMNSTINARSERELSVKAAVIQWLNLLLILVYILCFLFAKCRGKQESPPTFISSNKGKGKRIEKTYFDNVSEYGGRL